jgi:hypothetical protein
MTEFTKGPWIKCKRGESLIGVNGTTVGIHDCGLTGVNKSKESVANSDLISMAPELYEMVEMLVNELYQAIDECNNQRLSHITSQTETPPDLIDMESIHLAQLLLKKARGE